MLSATKRGFLLIAILLFVTPKANAADPRTDRNAALINSFQVFCMVEPMSFERIDQKSTAMQMAVVQDLGHVLPSGYFIRTKAWTVPLNTGPHELVAGEANGPNGHIKSCGISAPDALGDAFVRELIAELQLGTPVSQTLAAGGATRTTIWTSTQNEKSILRLTDASPSGRPGVTLNYEVAAAPLP